MSSSESYVYNATAHAMFNNQTDFIYVNASMGGWEGYPSDVYGMALIAPVMAGACLIGGIITSIVFYVSTKQQRHEEHKRAAKPQEDHQKIVEKLEHRRWNGAVAPCQSGMTEDVSSSSSTEDDVESQQPQFLPGAPLSFSTDDGSSSSNHNSAAPNHNNHTKSIFVQQPGGEESPVVGCAICGQAFQVDDHVCESNNPACRHVLHQHCIHEWLQYQNSCPICTLPYALNITTTTTPKHKKRKQPL